MNGAKGHLILATLVLSLPFSCCTHTERQETTGSARTEPRQPDSQNRDAGAPHADAGSDKAGEAGDSSSRSQSPSRPSSGIRIQYGYAGELGSLGIADTADAYEGTRLIARARALRIIKKQPGPNHILIEEYHYSEAGEVIYKGTLEFRFGFGGGTLVEQRSISGQKRLNVFGGWPAGN